MNLIHVDQHKSDRLAVLLNKAKMQYDKGFGRRYTYIAGLSLFKSAFTAISILALVLYNVFTVKKNEEDSLAILLESAAIIVKGLSLGLIKLLFSVIADPITIIREAYEKRRYLQGRTALLIVDAQKDFTKAGMQVIDGILFTYEEGSLGVPDGYAIVPIINDLLDSLLPNTIIAASLDWHPEGHKSFASSTPGMEPFKDKILLSDKEQIMWPDHCVQGSPGAEFLPGLKIKKIQYIVKKGTETFVDSYSAFFDNGRKNKTTLDEYLKGKSVNHIIIVGIATDYCVKYTALDALELGFKVTLVVDAVRGVGNEDSKKALKEMQAKGAKLLKLQEVLKTKDFKK